MSISRTPVRQDVRPGRAVLLLAVVTAALVLAASSLAEQRVDGRVLLAVIVLAVAARPAGRLLQRAGAWVNYGRPL